MIPVTLELDSRPCWLSGYVVARKESYRGITVETSACPHRTIHIHRELDIFFFFFLYNVVGPQRPESWRL